MILFCNNKTDKWLSDKSLAKHSELLYKARNSSTELKQWCQVWKKKLIEIQAKLLQAKQASLLRLQEKKVHQK